MAKKTHTGYNVMTGAVDLDAPCLPYNYEPDASPACIQCWEDTGEFVYANPCTHCICKWALHASCYKRMRVTLERSCPTCSVHVEQVCSPQVREITVIQTPPRSRWVVVRHAGPLGFVYFLAQLTQMIVTECIMMPARALCALLLFAFFIAMCLPSVHYASHYTIEIGEDMCPLMPANFESDVAFHVAKALYNDNLNVVTVQIDVNRLRSVVEVGLKTFFGHLYFAFPLVRFLTPPSMLPEPLAEWARKLQETGPKAAIDCNSQYCRRFRGRSGCECHVARKEP